MSSSKIRDLPVEVHWVDSATLSRWHEVGKDDVPAEIRTVGLLVKRERKHVSVALSRDATNDCVSDVINIPRSAIKSLKELIEK